VWELWEEFTDRCTYLALKTGWEARWYRAAGLTPGLSLFVLSLGYWGLNAGSCTPKLSFMLKINDRNNKNECTIFKFAVIALRRGLK
jgi:hypothetical protein